LRSPLPFAIKSDNVQDDRIYIYLFDENQSVGFDCALFILCSLGSQKDEHVTFSYYYVSVLIFLNLSLSVDEMYLINIEQPTAKNNGISMNYQDLIVKSPIFLLSD